VANVINALPFGQSSMLIRQQFTETALNDMAGDQPQAVEGLSEAYGITASVGDWDVTVAFVIVVLAAMAVVFTTLAALRIRSRIR
jgi:multidrug/hemolysin transport system permease protein